MCSTTLKTGRSLWSRAAAADVMVWFSISTTPAANALSWVRGQQTAGVVDDTAVVSFELVHAHYHTNKQTNRPTNKREGKRDTHRQNRDMLL